MRQTNDIGKICPCDFGQQCQSVIPNHLYYFRKLRTKGVHFYIAFAPERTIEGKALQELRSLPQIVGGFNRDSIESTVAIFRELTPLIVINQ